MVNYLKLVRVKHWLKNILIFLPIFFSRNIGNAQYYLVAILSFFVFSISASIIYVFNDIKDIDKDRCHPTKKNRCLASNKISIKNAYKTILVLIILDILLLVLLYLKTLSIYSFIIPFIYIIINVLYSKKLKDIPIIDILLLVSGFALRVLYGGILLNINISKYLYLVIIFGSSYLAFGKRRNEIIYIGKSVRKSLENYNKDFIEKSMYVSFILSIMSYILWCFDKDVYQRINNKFLYLTIPMILIIFLRYNLIIDENKEGDPIEIIFKDKILIIFILFYIISMIFIIY